MLDLLTLLSLLVCAAVIALWYTGDIYYFGRRWPRWSITGEQGTITVRRRYEWELDVAAHWVLVVGLALPALRAVLTRSRQLGTFLARRQFDGKVLCPTCGYDLHAGPLPGMRDARRRLEYCVNRHLPNDRTALSLVLCVRFAMGLAWLLYDWQDAAVRARPGSTRRGGGLHGRWGRAETAPVTPSGCGSIGSW